MQDIIKIQFDKYGDVIVDAHKAGGKTGHIEGSAKFTEELGKKLGVISERHKGHDVHTKDVQKVGIKVFK